MKERVLFTDLFRQRVMKLILTLLTALLLAPLAALCADDTSKVSRHPRATREQNDLATQMPTRGAMLRSDLAAHLKLIGDRVPMKNVVIERN